MRFFVKFEIDLVYETYLDIQICLVCKIDLDLTCAHRLGKKIITFTSGSDSGLDTQKQLIYCKFFYTLLGE